MKIWIHINGVQEGPFAPDQLPFNRMDPQTPVWYEGLDYWMPASAAPVTADLLRRYYAGEMQRRDNTVDVETSAQSETNIDFGTSSQSEGPVDEGRPSWQRERQTSWQQSSAQKYAAYSHAPQSRQTQEKCPATYLVWSIIMTLLCCNPLGIVAAVLGWTVTSKYNNYDYEGARRRSELTAWWFIITIVTSLIFTPMYMLVSM